MRDTIYRDDAIRVASGYCHPANVAKELAKLPSAQERKTGRWIHGREVAREMVGDVITAIFYEGWECSECHYPVEDEREPLWHYCPNCGSYNGGEG